jgi:hypothetical protein
MRTNRRKVMKKKLTYSAAVLGLTAVLTIPLMGFSAEAQGQSKIQPNQITLQSGGTSIPIGIGPFSTAAYHEPTDGIISAAAGCQPDLHEFDKNAIAYGPNGAEPAHIVFTAGISEFGTGRDKAEAFDEKGAKIDVEITSNGQKVMEQPLYLHPGVDPNTNKPFWVAAVWLKGDKPANLPDGDYNYQFKAKDKNGHVLAVWAPKNHKFTITDSTENN